MGGLFIFICFFVFIIILPNCYEFRPSQPNFYVSHTFYFKIEQFKNKLLRTFYFNFLKVEFR